MEHATPGSTPTARSPDFLVPDEPPRWPTVVGTISIVWAALGITCGGCGLLSPVLMSSFLASAEAQNGPMPDVMKPGPLQLVSAGAGLVWAVLLLVAGIMLVLRKPAARPLHLLYALGSIVLTVFGVVVTVAAQRAIAEWAANNPDSPWAQHHSPLGATIGLAFGVLMGLAWPVFLLIWFGAVKRTPASITGEHSGAE